MAATEPYITYQPLVTSARKSAGTRLVFRDSNCDSHAITAALAAIQETLQEGTGILLLSARNPSLLPVFAKEPLPPNSVVEVPESVAAQPPETTILPILAQRGIPFCVGLSGADASTPAWGTSGYVLAAVKSANDVPAWPKGTAKRILAPQSHEQARAHLESGGFACAGWPVPQTAPSKRAVGSSEQTILKLMQLIQQDADMAELDKVLRLDPSLAFRLLRYINSAAFGLSVEIQSFQHAVMMLGLQRLQRWLSLLLMSASKNPEQQPTMRLALQRALFMEKIGKEVDSEANNDEIFIVGAFSLLDRMMGIGFPEICDGVGLSEAVSDCLIDHGEPYGPLLALAEMCEQPGVRGLEDHAALLGLTPEGVNRALLEAIRESQQLDLG